MRQPSDVSQVAAALARRILAHETAGQWSPEAVGDALERACQRLRQRLLPPVGSEGFDALLLGALRLARADYPFLRALERAPDTTECFRGLREATRGRESAEATEGLVGVLGGLLWLLVRFLGEELTLRLVRTTWPDLPGGATGPGTRE